MRIRNLASDNLKGLYAQIESMGDKVVRIISINAMGAAWYFFYEEKPEVEKVEAPKVAEQPGKVEPATESVEQVQESEEIETKSKKHDHAKHGHKKGK